MRSAVIITYLVGHGVPRTKVVVRNGPTFYSQRWVLVLTRFYPLSSAEEYLATNQKVGSSNLSGGTVGAF
jgi:hypothetical protein